MPHNYYSEINLHVTWHTKNSLPLLTQTVEPLVHRYIKQRLVNEKGIFIHEIGGTETHVHLALTIQPTIVISDLIGQLKGYRNKLLQWQTGYGVVSFGTGDLDWVKSYVRDQRRHHAEGKTFDRLERFVAVEDVQDARERA